MSTSTNVHHLPERYLTKRQVAERLGFSLRWVEMRVADGTAVVA